MNNQSRFTISPLVIGSAVVGVLLLITLVLTFRGGDKQEDTGKHNLDDTTITSKLSQSSQTFTVNYGGDADPNMDAVKQQFKLFAPDSLPIPDNIKKDLESILSEELSRQVTPTDATTFIQIDKNSIDCANPQNCNFSFYIDSPEMYFDFKMRVKGYEPYFQITQQPWTGGAKKRGN